MSGCVDGPRCLLFVNATAHLVRQGGYTQPLVLGGGFLYYAIRLMNPPDELFALKTFHYSIWYLAALFAFLLIDHYLPQPRFGPVPMVLVPM